MSTVSKSFTAVGAGPVFTLKPGQAGTYAVTGTFTASWILEKSKTNGATWETVDSGSATDSGTLLNQSTVDSYQYRFRCSAYTSGTIVTSLADVSTEQLAAWQNKDGTTVLEITEAGITTPDLNATTAQVTGAATVGSLVIGTDIAVDFVDVVISSAQILALNATPQTLVAAPGANKVLIPHKVIIFLDYNSAAYAGIAAGEDLVVRYTDGSGSVIVGIEATGFLDATSDKYAVGFPGVSGTLTFESSEMLTVNAALVLHMTSGEITTGNSPIAVRTYYSTIDLSTLTTA